MHRLVLLSVCVIRPMSGDTVQTGSRKIDPARKFKCTLAARGPVCCMYNVIENQTMSLIIGLSVFYNVNTPTLGGGSLIKTPHLLVPAGRIFCRIETTQLQIWRKKSVCMKVILKHVKRYWHISLNIRWCNFINLE